MSTQYSPLALGKRPCLRFEFDGTSCGRPTTYADRWCRECDGYGTAEPALWSPSPPIFHFKDRRAIADVPDMREDLQVARSAIEQFQKRHPGHDRGSVDAQLRRLVDDILQGGDEAAHVSRGPGGEWALSTAQPQPHGYSVLLDHSGGLVIGYRTKHRERTYAQAKEGVRSRTSLKNEKKHARNFGVLLAHQVFNGEVEEEAARLRALGHGHPKAVESFEKVLKGLREPSGTTPR